MLAPRARSCSSCLEPIFVRSLTNWSMYSRLVTSVRFSMVWIVLESDKGTTISSSWMSPMEWRLTRAMSLVCPRGGSLASSLAGSAQRGIEPGILDCQ